MGNVRVTGLLRAPADAGHALERIEVEVEGGAGRLRFAQAPGPGARGMLGALLVDDVPTVASLRGAGDDGAVEAHGALVLAPHQGAPLPAVPELRPGAVLDEAGVLALAPLLEQLADGLYTVSLRRGAPPPVGRMGWTRDASGRVELDVAARTGGAVLADLGGGVTVLLAGRDQARRGPLAWVVSADVILGGEGFEARHHDRGDREAFARSPRGALDDGAFRDAVARLRAAAPDVDVGPFTEDRVEPAAQQARALVWDLRAEDGIESVSEPWRERVGVATEMRARVRVKSVTFEIAFVSQDGRRVDEVVVRSGGRYRATGLRPAARALARSLRQLADEGG